MPTDDPPKVWRLGVYVNTPDEAERARQIFGRISPDIHEYHGEVTGMATAQTLKELCEAGLMVVSSSPPGTDPLPGSSPIAFAPVGQPGAPSREVTDVDLRRGLLEQMERQARSQPLRGPTADARDVALAADESPAPTMYEVQLLGPMRPEWADTLRDLSITVSSYRFPYTYRMALTPAQLAQVAKLAFVRGKPERYGLGHTLTPEFLTEMEQAQAKNDSEPKLFDLTVHAGDQVYAIRELIQTLPGAQVVESAGKSIRFSAPINAPYMPALADRDEVKLLTPFKPPELFVEQGRRLLGIPAESGAAWPWNGEGEIVGIVDSGIDVDHPDFKATDGTSRVTAKAVEGATTDDLVGHGTHVAGIIGGNGAASMPADKDAAKSLRGMAPEAKLVMLGIVKDGRLLMPPDLSPLLDQLVKAGASIINMSLGTRLSGRYDSYSESVDQFIYDHPNVLVVIAAGNEGTAESGYPEYRSIGTPASAKNALTVGACLTARSGIAKKWEEYNPAKYKEPFGAIYMAGDPDIVAGLSSRGPTDFESIKPEVLAPGTYIVSAKAAGATMPHIPYPANDKYMYLSGTSMAAPFLAGAAAVLRQYLRQQCAVPDPSAALLKAILCASVRRCKPLIADGLKSRFGYPDFDQGFGRVDLSTVLPHADDKGRRLAFRNVPNDSPQALMSRQPVDGPKRQSRHRYQLTIPDGGGPLYVVLVWTDLAERDLQNTLQLDVRGPGGLGLVGNHDHRWKKDGDLPIALDTPAPVPFDRINNVQMVFIEKPPPGDYTVIIHADNTTHPGIAQGYAICARGTLDSEIVSLDA